jgi:hypothetical protein
MSLAALIALGIKEVALNMALSSSFESDDAFEEARLDPYPEWASND